MDDANDGQERDNIEEVLGQIIEQAGAMISSCEYQSSFEKYGEARQKAKQEKLALYYVHCTFFQMDQAQYLLDFSTMRERAIELISLLGDYEQILKIQPDCPVDYYEYQVYDKRPCGYENLAEATGMMQGYNSDGLHECVSDGIHVCKSVGKLGCINCFREYACDVYLAADDFELARHQCQTVIDHKGEWQARGNRRWLGQNRMAWADLLTGDLQGAKEGYQKALEFAEEPDVGLLLESKFRILVELEAALILGGEPAQLPNHEVFRNLPPRGQSPLFDLKNDWIVALRAVVEKDYAAGEKILTEWDATLRQAKATHLWFENRLRLIALKRLSGDSAGAELLAESVEERAKKANDWLTIRRLDEVIGASEDPSPIGVGRLKTGSAVAVATPDSSATQEEDEQDKKYEMQMTPEFGARIEAVSTSIGQAAQEEDEEAFQKAAATGLEKLLTITPEDCSVQDNSAAAILMMCQTISFVGPDRGKEAWKWANGVARPYQNSAYIVSLLATLGHRLLAMSPDPENPIVTQDRLKQMFKQSLQLPQCGPGSHARAGDFFVAIDEVGEAERCYARSFKLDRTNPDVATSLAGLYANTDRPRDALYVLDLCLREGTEHPVIAFQAATHAMDLNQFEAVLSYLDKLMEFDEVELRSPIPFLRSMANLHLGRPDVAFEQIAIEQSCLQDGENDFHVNAIRALSGQKSGDKPTAAQAFTLAVNARLDDFQAVSNHNVIRLFKELYQVHNDFDVPANVKDRLFKRLLAYGEMDPDYFNSIRQERPKQPEVILFVVLLSQEVDNWKESPFRLPDTEEYDHYLAEWEVLAPDSEEASRLAVEAQAQCAQGRIRVLEARQEAGPWEESSGVTFQGRRQFIPREFMNFDEMDEGPSAG